MSIVEFSDFTGNILDDSSSDNALSVKLSKSSLLNLTLSESLELSDNSDLDSLLGKLLLVDGLSLGISSLVIDASLMIVLLNGSLNPSSTDLSIRTLMNGLCSDSSSPYSSSDDADGFLICGGNELSL